MSGNTFTYNSGLARPNPSSGQLVVDSATLITLAKANNLDLLFDAGRAVVVTSTVWRQLRGISRHPAGIAWARAGFQRASLLFGVGLMQIICGLFSVAYAGSVGIETSTERLLWSEPGFSIMDATRSPQGTLYLLAQTERKKLLLSGTGSFESWRKIDLPDLDPLRDAKLRIKHDGRGNLWLGGTKNYGKSFAGVLLSDAHLAKLDESGSLVWQIEISRSRKNQIQDIVPLGNGGVVAVGIENGSNWLVAFSGDGRLLWEKTFGAGKINSVVIAKDTIVVAGFAAAEQDKGFSVNLWRFDFAGNLIDQRRVRDQDAQSPTAMWLMKVFLRDDELYVFSAWTEQYIKPRTSAPLAVTKIGEAGKILWTKTLEDTLLPSRIGPLSCVRDVTVLSDGSPLIECANENGTTLSRLDTATGEPTRSFLPNNEKPNCKGSAGSILLVVPNSVKSFWAFGGGVGCTWLQDVSLK